MPGACCVEVQKCRSARELWHPLADERARAGLEQQFDLREDPVGLRPLAAVAAGAADERVAAALAVERVVVVAAAQAVVVGVAEQAVRARVAVERVLAVAAADRVLAAAAGD